MRRLGFLLLAWGGGGGGEGAGGLFFACFHPFVILFANSLVTQTQVFLSILATESKHHCGNLGES